MQVNAGITDSQANHWSGPLLRVRYKKTQAIIRNLRVTWKMIRSTGPMEQTPDSKNTTQTKIQHKL